MKRRKGRAVFVAVSTAISEKSGRAGGAIGMEIVYRSGNSVLTRLEYKLDKLQ